MGTFHKPSTKGKMLSCFPAAPPKINGEPTTWELIRVLQHLILCGQTHEVDYCKNNLLFLVIQENIWSQFSEEAWPAEPMEPKNNGPVFTNGMDAWAAAKLKNTWEYENKMANDSKEMNKALIECFISLLDSNYHVKFTREFIKNPAVAFKEVFRYYTEQYGSTDRDDWLKNEQRMKAEWHLSQGFHLLVNQLEEELLYGSMIGAPVDDKRVVDIGLNCVKRCGLLSTAYGEWITKEDQSFEQYKEFWKLKCDLLCKTTQAAAQYGYDGDVVQGDDDWSFQQTVDQFTEVHNVTQ